jgi:SAM-dependent methyltransferase
MTEQGWGSKEVADAWKARAEERRRSMAAVTERMVEEAGVTAGMRVLDLGTGAAEAALFVAERVGPTGSVVAVDSSKAMVEAARQAVTEAGARNVTVLPPMDAASLDLEAASFDAVVGRQVLMFTDVPKALAEVRRVLRPMARLGATVWGALAGNPYHRIVIEAVRERGGWGEPVPDVVRAFAYDNEAFWRHAMLDAGFGDVGVYTMQVERGFASAAEAFEAIRTSPIHGAPVGRLPQTEREAAWQEIEAGCRAFGGMFPSQYRVLSGRGVG